MNVCVKMFKAIFMMVFLLMISLFAASAHAALFDFNGDGTADILWQHSGGTVATWLMSNTGTISSVTVPGSIDSSWQIR